MHNVLRSRVCLCLLLGALGATAVPATPHAATPPGIALSAGERVLELAWADSGNLTLVVETAEGFAMRRLELATGELSVIPVPRSFSWIKHPKEGATPPEFYLAPAGNALAVLERSAEPLSPNDLSVFKLEPNGLATVSTRTIPREFYVEHVAWEQRGQELFLASRSYLFPEQAYSLGRLTLRTESFAGLTLKDNLSLVEQMVFVPHREAVAVKCRGYRGEYPAQPVIALVELGVPAEHIIHSRAANLALFALGDGQLLLSPAPTQAGNGTSDAISDQWVLKLGESDLRRASLALEGCAPSLDATSSGSWLGFLAAGRELGLADDPNSSFLGLQRITDGRTLVTAVPSEDFAFSPTGEYVCAVAQGGEALYFYELPTGQR